MDDGKRTERPRSRQYCCGLAGSAGRIGLLRAGWGCWCGLVALALSRGHGRQATLIPLALMTIPQAGLEWKHISICDSIYANGKVELVSGPIQPIDVLSGNGRRYFVKFNELHQPLRKGGHILEHFNIPNDDVYGKLALQRVDKYWRHYTHELKKIFFHPNKKLKNNTMTQYQVDILVMKAYFEAHFKRMAALKAAALLEEANSAENCSSHDHVNMSSNIQIEGNKLEQAKNEDEKCDNGEFVEAEHGKLMGLIEDRERSNVRKDGIFVEGMATEDFLSDVYGVRGLVRKEGYFKGKMKFVELDLNSNSYPCNKKKKDLDKRNEELSMKYNENNNLLKTVVTQFSEFLDVMRNGNASIQLIDAA
ncbi:40S ribosomal protein S8-A [Bienertia sinuspersici]